MTLDMAGLTRPCGSEEARGRLTPAAVLPRRSMPLNPPGERIEAEGDWGIGRPLESTWNVSFVLNLKT